MGSYIGSPSTLADLLGQGSPFAVPNPKYALKTAADRNDYGTVKNLNAFYGEPAYDAFVQLGQSGMKPQLQMKPSSTYNPGIIDVNRQDDEDRKRLERRNQALQQLRDAGFDAR